MSTQQSETHTRHCQCCVRANCQVERLSASVSELSEYIDKQRVTMEALELANTTLRRRVASLEGVVNP